MQQLGDLQLAIMRVLWRLGEATSAEVHEHLREDRGLAPTTVSTMLIKMENRGLVSHRSQGRKFIYRPEVSEIDARRGMVGELKERLFSGDVTALVSHLLDEHEVSPGELQRLRALIDAHERKQEDPT